MEPVPQAHDGAYSPLGARAPRDLANEAVDGPQGEASQTDGDRAQEILGRRPDRSVTLKILN